MDVYFGKDKDLKTYEAYIENPADRQAYRKFTKVYPKEIADEAIKRHKLFKKYPSAKDYNDVYGASQNRIEKKEGIKDKDPFILKVRINGAWRKFFNIFVDDNDDLLLKKDWNGQFEEVKSIYVVAVQ